MSKLTEPCLCGAPDCRQCFPFTYKRTNDYLEWESHYADTFPTFDEFLDAKYERTSPCQT